MKKNLLLVFSCLLTIGLRASTVHETLFINKGQFKAIDQRELAYYAFNSSPSFNQENQRIELVKGDSLVLWIHNTDAVEHGFELKGMSIKRMIAAGDSTMVNLRFDELGTYIYHDYSGLGKFSYMGLSSMLVVTSSEHKNFYWNIKDHQADFNDSLEADVEVDWTQYYPEYFTINSRSNPQVDLDSSAHVRGAVGDSILIHISNTGRAIHSLHFHGYHATIVQSSKQPEHRGRSKDTFPVYGGEVLVLLLIPHQSGEFPVHDHNLVAVTGGGRYPNGMFTTLSIQ